MSLNTLLEAAKFLELQEIRQQQNTITAIPAVNGGGGESIQLHNGNTQQQATTTAALTLQSIKVLSATTLANIQPQPATQTVVISSNNISSTLLQGSVPFTPSSPLSTTVVNHSPPVQLKKEQDGHISSTTSQTQQHRRIMHNSFDIMKPLVIDEGGSMEQKKVKQPPMVFRSGTREVHNKLEKCRRAHLKECFDLLKKQLPANGDEKKTSNLSILHSALKYIQMLKRREAEFEHQLERLAREKIVNQQRLATLKKDCPLDGLELGKILPDGMKIKRENELQIIPSPSYTTTSFRHEEEVHYEADEDGDETFTVSSIPDQVSSVISQTTNSVITATNGEKLSIPILGKGLPIVSATGTTQTAGITKEVPTTGISVVPMPYSVNQPLVLQKVAIVPHHKGLNELTPLMPTHFITTPQQLNGQINGKVVPLTQYIVKPMVVVSTASPRPGS